jgi:hypothetical protein
MKQSTLWMIIIMILGIAVGSIIGVSYITQRVNETFDVHNGMITIPELSLWMMRLV